MSKFVIFPLNILDKSIKNGNLQFLRNIHLSRTCFSVIDKYNQSIKNGTLNYDENQIKIVEKLNQFYLNYENLKESDLVPNTNNNNNNSKSFFSKLFFKEKNIERKLNIPLKGIYLWGGVGCGKTMLMDLTFDQISTDKKKKRLHFNKFMLDIHKRIHFIKTQSSSDISDPIPIVAEQIVNEVKLLFFDEFQVTDIVDAMLMSRLFTELFNRGLIIFSTSNRPPDDLYKNGLQRDSFIPFIDILKQFCDVINLHSLIDYRKLAYPLDGKLYYQSTKSKIQFETFVNELILAENSPICEMNINLLDRNIHLKRTCNRLLDTDFSFMCEEARGSIDYLKFCKFFDTIILRDIPIIDLNSANKLRRFIVFIDTVYDNRVKLVCSGEAAKPELIFKIENACMAEKHMIDDGLVDNNKNNNIKNEKTKFGIPSLYTLEEEIFAIDRTISRLMEMQSESYWKECETRIELKKKLKPVS